MMRPESSKSAAPPPAETPALSATPARAKEARASAAGARDRLAVLSIFLIASALGTMLYVQFSATPSGAALVGAVAFAILLLGHEHLHKSAEIARLKKELARLQGIGGQQRSAPDAHDSAPLSGSAAPADRPGANEIGKQAAPRRRISVLTAEQQAAEPNVSRPGKQQPPAPQPQPQAKAADPLRDQWSFRPSEPSMTAPPPPPAAQGAPTGAASTIETDLALVQRKIKALADEVNATETPRHVLQTAPDANAAQAALETSIGALRAAGGAMRENPRPARERAAAPVAEPQRAAPAPANSLPVFEFAIPATAERIAAAPPPAAVAGFPPEPELPAPSADASPPAMEAPLDFNLPMPEFLAAAPKTPRLAAISRAIDTGRMDVWLSPIVGLMNHDVSHYEMKVRLQSDDGGYLDDVEGELVLAGADMLALFDAARLHRASVLARRLDSRGKGGSLLSDVAGASLTSGTFLDTFARVYEERERIASQLVLTFSQEDCERFSPSAWQALGDMQSFGFRFALDRIQILDMNFEDLAQRGFAFVKLEASALLDGLPARDRFYTAAEVCSRLAGAGLTLIADAVDSDATRARLFGFGVLFGQGQLFGGARRVSIDVGASSQAA